MKTTCRRCGSPLETNQCSNDACPFYGRSQGDTLGRSDNSMASKKLINLCVTITCLESDAIGIEKAVENCIETLDGVEGYVFGQEDRDWEDDECRECGAVIPDADSDEGSLANRHHKDSCSLYDKDLD